GRAGGGHRAGPGPAAGPPPGVRRLVRGLRPGRGRRRGAPGGGRRGARRAGALDGSVAPSARIAAAAGGRQGVFVWDRDARAATLFPVPLWLQRGQLSLLLPERGGPGDLAALRRGLPGPPLV